MKEVKIGNKTIQMEANANTPRYYRQIFGKDMIVQMMTTLNGVKNGKVTEDLTLELAENLAYVMAKQANEGIGTVDDFLSQFGVFDIYNATEDIFSVWQSNEKTTSEAKKK